MPNGVLTPLPLPSILDLGKVSIWTPPFHVLSTNHHYFFCNITHLKILVMASYLHKFKDYLLREGTLHSLWVRSPTRDGTQVTEVKAPSPKCWTTRECPEDDFLVSKRIVCKFKAASTGSTKYGKKKLIHLYAPDLLYSLSVSPAFCQLRSYCQGSWCFWFITTAKLSMPYL